MDFFAESGLIFVPEWLGGIEINYPGMQEKKNPDHASIPFHVMSTLLVACSDPFKDVDLKCLVNVLTLHNFLNTIFSNSCFVSKLHFRMSNENFSGFHTFIGKTYKLKCG